MSLSMRKAMSRREFKSAERIGEKVSDGSGIGAVQLAQSPQTTLILHPAKQEQASLLVGLLMRNMFLAFAASFFINVVFKLIDRHRLFLNDILE